MCRGGVHFSGHDICSIAETKVEHQEAQFAATAIDPLCGTCLSMLKIICGGTAVGFVLSPIAEEQLRASLMMTDGDVSQILYRPWAMVFLAMSILTIFWPAVATRIGKRSRTEEGKL